MKLNLTKPLVFFDIESTGLNIATDAIIELSFVKVFPDGSETIKTWRVRPWDYNKREQIPISAGASQVNGIKDEDLVSCPKFIDIVVEITQMIKGCDLGGFNSTKFDLPMLAEEIERVKAYCTKCMNSKNISEDRKEKIVDLMKNIDIDLHTFLMVDVQNIFHFMEPRNLRAAYSFYCGGKDLDNAHTAEADTIATYEVLKGQLDKYQDSNNFQGTALKNDVKALSEIAKKKESIDFAGRISLVDGEPTIAFGKYKDRSVREIYKTDKNYFSWISNGEFTMDTKRQFAKLYEQYKEEENKPREVNQEDLKKLLSLNTK